MIIDGGIQTIWNIQSTSFRRSLTGALFGFSMMIIIRYIFQKTDEKNNDLIKFP